MAASSGHSEFKHQIVNGSARMISFGGLAREFFDNHPSTRDVGINYNKRQSTSAVRSPID